MVDLEKAKKFVDELIEKYGPMQEPSMYWGIHHECGNTRKNTT